MRDKTTDVSKINSSFGLDDYLADVWEWESPAFADISVKQDKQNTDGWFMLSRNCLGIQRQKVQDRPLTKILDRHANP